MNPPLAFCQPNTGLPLVALGSLAPQESIIATSQPAKIASDFFREFCYIAVGPWLDA